MRQELALRILSEVMHWDTSKSREEFTWLRLMSRLKYNRYQDFLAGARFIESLVDWLQQFEHADRATAYEFVRNHLVYVSHAEMQHLVELAYSETIRPYLTTAVATRLNIPTYRVWSQLDARQLYTRLLRQTLFLALSDGARIDIFRRSNVGAISNEQVLVTPQPNSAKWNGLLRDLRTDLNDPSARFAFVFLIDDFVGSGTTLLRLDDNTWEGKLVTFLRNIEEIAQTHLEPQWKLGVHHYIATHKACENLDEREAKARRSPDAKQWFHETTFSYGMILPADLPIDERRYQDLMRLITVYYDSSIATRHFEKGGSDDARLGFGHCALPLVLDHNTPNNSIALLWAESEDPNCAHAMRPLFRRRQRHL
ncbi:hypothetical protein SE17_00725 [Kouleothrix aurantiaca]|uniref:PRTase-CE domain-containing protein n=1 Tax=Kouleothrix aurantiaca TaxID=186479 RepID=A0A0P9HIZ7_9CHLR|nr:hypothetical protein SE17_00725 [Kouleothrix aurantiaca]